MKSILNKITFFLSYLVVLTEKSIQSFWQAFLVLIYYVSFVFVAIKKDWVSTPAHQILFFIATAAFIYFFYKGSKTFSWPTRNRVISAIEEKNKIKRGSISAIKDKNSMGDGTLWGIFQEKTRRSLPFLKPSPIRTNLSKKDPFALRFLSLLILIVAFWFSTPFTAQLFVQNLVPTITIPAWMLPVKPQLNAWIIPPQYTGIAPIVLNKDTVQPIIIPEGSKINLNITPAFDESSLKFSETDIIPFEKKSDDVMTYEGLISNSTDQITLTLDGDVEYSWKSYIEEDMVPEIAFLTDPKETDGKSIQIQYIAQDDYGIKNTKLTIDIAESYIGKPEPMTFDIPNGVIKKEEGRNIFEGQYFQDLTSHPWSGKTVSMMLTTEDDFGHVVTSDPKVITLPERTFKNPVAQKIIQIRNILLDNYEEAHDDAVEALEYILVRPGLYGNKPTTFLVLKAALNRLYLDRKKLEQDSVTNLLWDIALSLEEGQIFEKQKELRKAQNELMKALNDQNTTTDQINTLLDQYKEAIQNMANEVMKEMAQQLSEGKTPTLPFNPEMMNKNGLDQMMEELKHLAETGQKEKLMEALLKMQNMMENAKSQKLSENQMQGLELLQDLNAVVEEQTEILEKTKEVTQQQKLFPNEAKKQGNQIDALAMQQRDLRGKLETVMDELNKLTPNQDLSSLADARTSMQEATDELSAKKTNEALLAEQEALEKLQQSIKDTMKNIEENLNISFSSSPFAIPMPGKGMQPMPASDGQYDPFGRKSSANENIFLDETENQDGVKKSKEIIHELRKRSGERYREKEELDYIDRLLDRF